MIMAKLPNELDVNLELSINFSLRVIVLPLSIYALIGTEKLIYLSAFSPKHSN